MENVSKGFFEGELYVSGELWFDFLVRLVVNIIALFILIRFIYYPNNNRITYIFTFFLMGMMIFLIASVLDQVRLEMGLALGLFAIFGIIRFRSPSIDLKEMTYLFLSIGISVINALVLFNIANWFGLLIANFIILSITFLMEHYKPKGYVLKRQLIFTPTDYSILSDKKRLLEIISKDMGINVLRVDINRINKAKNEVSVNIYFRQSAQAEEIPENLVEDKELESDYWTSNSTSF
jgi:hypothetical protein